MKKYKVGLTVGVFDLFHIGHLRLLERCKEMCDYLIVAICDDDYVVRVKGRKPVFDQDERAQIISALRIVDETRIIDSNLVENKLLIFECVHFDVLFSGDDWKGSERFKKTEELFKNRKIDIEYFPYTQGISSSLIKRKLIDLKY